MSFYSLGGHPVSIVKNRERYDQYYDDHERAAKTSISSSQIYSPRHVRLVNGGIETVWEELNPAFVAGPADPDQSFLPSERFEPDDVFLAENSRLLHPLSASFIGECPPKSTAYDKRAVSVSKKGYKCKSLYWLERNKYRSIYDLQNFKKFAMIARSLNLKAFVLPL